MKLLIHTKYVYLETNLTFCYVFKQVDIFEVVPWSCELDAFLALSAHFTYRSAIVRQQRRPSCFAKRSYVDILM